VAYNVSGDEGLLVETTKGARVMIGSRRAQELETAIASATRDLTRV
jgi:tetraacyldisaccharide-1-P 4'-kinase